jgi:hypothetical protein
LVRSAVGGIGDLGLGDLRLTVSGPWAPYSFAVFDRSAG